MSISSDKPTRCSATVVNLAAYKFVSLDNLPARQHELKSLCDQAQLKGTILLSPEGINLFVAGRRSSVDRLLAHLNRDPLLADISVKENYNDRVPFDRMLVRIKAEIIAFGIDEITPGERTSPKLTPTELKTWLDEGKPITLLDTRNTYEIELGTFHNAKHLNLRHFRDFPQAVDSLPEEMKDRPIVMFCTGGIRCEKAGPYMEQVGFPNVYQLEGGILKYFEECGGEHYQGDCFVFDQRLALNPQLEETANKICLVCRSALSLDDQDSAEYVYGKSCPHCLGCFGQRS